MSNYPPPPQPDQQHYNPVYPASSASHALLDPEQQAQLAFASQLTEATEYPKVEHDGLDPTTSIQIEQRIEQLQHQQSLDQSDQLHHDDFHDDQEHQQPIPTTELNPLDQNSAQSKLFRLRKACDSCSIRKVKCDESGPPCKACAALDIPCTFERPSRRRGPPNRHAEAIKRRRVEEPSGPGLATPSSPTHAAQALAALSSHPPASTQLSAESILPADTIDLLINDYFTYIHPLCPFPHEPSFREAWRRREDYTNRGFLALLSSMIAVLVAAFPKKHRQHLRLQRRDKLIVSSLELVDTCFKICATSRGPGYLENKNISVHDAATSYLLSLASTYTSRWKQSRLYLGECLTIIKSLGLHRARDDAYFDLDSGTTIYGSEGPDFDASKQDLLDHITRQVGRRVFWTAFVAVRTITRLGASHGEIYIPPSTATDPYPPLPLEVEDFCIFPAEIDPQPAGMLPAIAGFNANVRIFLSYQSLTIMELACSMTDVVDWERQKRMYQECLLASKSVLRELPEEFKLLPGTTDIDDLASDPLAGFHMKMGLREAALASGDGSDSHPDQRRAMQREIQKANLFASGLATRSYIVERFWTAHEAHNATAHTGLNGSTGGDGSYQLNADVFSSGLDALLPPAAGKTEPGVASIESEMSLERENLVRSLLVVLSNIERVNMEPNGDSLAHKIRFIAFSLLGAPSTRKGMVARQAEESLKVFFDILTKLDRARHEAETMSAELFDDAESRYWNDLKEYQDKLAGSGGLLSIE